MFCPHCGQANQSPDAYCTNCGEFLLALSGNTTLIDRLFGANTLDKRVNVGLVFDALTLISSMLLLIFLFGYFDGRFARTGEGAPPIIYFVYLFLALTAIWQLLSLLVGFSHKNKLGGRRKVAAKTNQADGENEAVLPEATRNYLPPADFDNVVPPSVAEDTTRQLNKSRRK